MRELVAEIIGILSGSKIAISLAPIGDRVYHSMHQLAHAALALGRPHLAVEILADDDVGGRLGPVGRNLHIVLFEYDGAFVVRDDGSPQFPGDFVVRRLSGLELLREIFWKAHSRPLRNRECLLVNFLQFGNLTT